MTQGPVTSIALITSQALSLINFRGPLIRELVARGVRCYALAPDFDDRLRGEVEALGAEPFDISMRRASISPFRDVCDLFSLSRILRKLKPGASLTYFIKPVIYGSLAARLAGIPKRYSIIEGAGYVFSVDNRGMTLKFRLLRRAIRYMYRFSLHFVEKVFFLNPDDVRLFVDDLHILPANRTVAIPGIGVDLKTYHKETPVTSPVTFILIARLLIQKGIREYALAARELSKLYHNVRFLLLGDVDDNPDSLSRDEIQGWVDEGLIEWPGHVDNVRPWLTQSSVVVLPSTYREGLPRSLMEGMAMGRPIITTDSPGCRETVVEGVNGYLVPPHNVEALAAAMLEFIKQPELIEKMGLESCRLAEQRFDVIDINRKILNNIGISAEPHQVTDASSKRN